MKKFILLVWLLQVTIVTNAQDLFSQTDSVTTQDDKIEVIRTYSQHERDSVLSVITVLLDDIGYRIRGLDRYKMYPTENMYNLLKLDTKTGRIQQVQWSSDKNNEFILTINNNDLSYDTGCGTFELYPTQNMYQG